MDILERFPLAYCESCKCQRAYRVEVVEVGANRVNDQAYADLLCNRCHTIIACVSGEGVTIIPRTEVEIRSGIDRLRFAEKLISRLPKGDEGRNTWLLNYGRGDEAQAMRREQGIGFDEDTQAAPIVE
jgi:hypothetical protein